MYNLAPIVLFVYNRPEHTKRTVESLLANTLADKSYLYIFSDGPKSVYDTIKVLEVRKYLQTIQGFHEIIVKERKENLGLANSVISGITEVFNMYNGLIVLEDDIITSSYFLTFMNNALEFYKNTSSIFSISGYLYPIKFPYNFDKDVFITYRPSSWGWATWKDRWQQVNWNLNKNDSIWKDKNTQQMFKRAGDDLAEMLFKQLTNKIDSWAIRWAYEHFKRNKYSLYPKISLCRNIGMDGSGTHSSITQKYDSIFSRDNSKLKLEENLELDENLSEAIRIFVKPSIIRRTINSLKIFIRKI